MISGVASFGFLTNIPSIFRPGCYITPMSTASEVEEAILSLPPEELEKLAGWWNAFSAKRAALEGTAGYLGPDDEDFTEAVSEAGRDMACDG